jgi:hypothetical protein
MRIADLPTDLLAVGADGSKAAYRVKQTTQVSISSRFDSGGDDVIRPALVNTRILHPRTPAASPPIIVGGAAH